jgi:hypothetical protein
MSVTENLETSMFIVLLAFTKETYIQTTITSDFYMYSNASNCSYLTSLAVVQQL